MKRFLAPALGAALLTGAWASGPAGAQEDAGERVVLRAVDATDADAVKLVVSYSGDDAASQTVSVTENGEAVDITLGDLASAGLASDIAFVFDTSASTDGNALLDQATRAVSELVADLPPGTRVAIVSAGGASQLAQRLTTDQARLQEALEDLTPNDDGAVLSGVVRAADVVDVDGSVPTVVLFTDGVEDSTTSIEIARGGLLDAGATLHVIGLQDGGLDEAAFGSLAAQTGGRMLTATDAGAIEGLVGALRGELLDLRSITFATAAGNGVQDLEVTIGDATTEGSYITGSVLVGANRVAPRPPVEPGGIAFFRTDLGRYLGFGLAFVAVALFAYAMIVIFTKEKTALSLAMQPYADGYVSGEEGGDDAATGMAQTAFLQRAVAMTESFADRQGFLTKLEHKLERADLPLRAGEALFFYSAGLVLVFIALVAMTQNLLAAVVVGAVIALVPPGLLGYLTNKKKKAFEGLLPDTLQLLSSTLRAGYSMMQGVEAVSQEVAEPMGKELRRVVTEARLGRPLEESLDSVAERMDSPDFAWAVMAIRIQREVGGNLSELLMTVSETMTQRERLRRDVASLTAEGRISAYVLIALPLGLAGFLWSVNPDYIGKLFDVTMGQIMLGAAILMMVVGYAWMMKIIKIAI